MVRMRTLVTKYTIFHTGCALWHPKAVTDIPSEGPSHCAVHHTSEQGQVLYALVQLLFYILDIV